jgi:hypothetical protein
MQADYCKPVRQVKQASKPDYGFCPYNYIGQNELVWVGIRAFFTIQQGQNTGNLYIIQVAGMVTFIEILKKVIFI